MSVLAFTFFIFISGFGYNVWRFKRSIQPAFEFTNIQKKQHNTLYEKSMRAYYRLRKLWFITFLIVVIIWLVQAWNIYKMTSFEEYEEVDESKYTISESIFLYLQIISLTVILRYAWIPLDLVGTIKNMSNLYSQSNTTTVLETISEGREEGKGKEESILTSSISGNPPPLPPFQETSSSEEPSVELPKQRFNKRIIIAHPVGFKPPIPQNLLQSDRRSSLSDISASSISSPNLSTLVSYYERGDEIPEDDRKLFNY